MSDKSEALKLAEIVDSFDARSEHMPLEIYGIISSELLRLNAVNQELLEALQKAVRYGGLFPDLKAEADAAITKATGEAT